MATAQTSFGPAPVAREERRRADVRRERFEARISAEQKRLLQHAADIRGVTLTDFVISSAQHAASVAIREDEVLMLRARDREAFVRALINPPAPNERLLSAARRYRETRG